MAKIQKITIQSTVSLTAALLQYYFPTPGDSDTLRPGGLADTTLDDVTFLQFCFCKILT